MNLSRIVEYVFFFGLLLISGYMVWLIAAPFLSALALAIIIVTICNPLHERIKHHVPYNNKTIAAFLTTIVVLVAIVLPLVSLSSLVVGQIVDFYQSFELSDGISSIDVFEAKLQQLAPNFEIDVREQIRAVAQWFAGNLGAIFAGTVSTLFTFLIAIIGSFYFFRDGQELLQLLIKASPLPDSEDRIIFSRMASAVRAVATGTLFLALIQGTLVSIGFAVVGIEHAILWGSLASVGALMPGIGTSIVTAPAVIYLFTTGNMVPAIGLLTWSVLIVGLVDNFVGPYLMSRKNNMHPFIILIAVLGGISLFGPIGFIIGPVIVTLFLVLLEIYSQYIVHEKRVSDAIDVI